MSSNKTRAFPPQLSTVKTPMEPRDYSLPRSGDVHMSSSAEAVTAL